MQQPDMRLPVIIINDCWEYIIELEHSSHHPPPTPPLENRAPHKSTRCHCDEVVELIQGAIASRGWAESTVGGLNCVEAV